MGGHRWSERRLLLVLSIVLAGACQSAAPSATAENGDATGDTDGAVRFKGEVGPRFPGDTYSPFNRSGMPLGPSADLRNPPASELEIQRLDLTGAGLCVETRGDHTYCWGKDGKDQPVRWYGDRPATMSSSACTATPGGALECRQHHGPEDEKLRLVDAGVKRAISDGDRICYLRKDGAVLCGGMSRGRASVDAPFERLAGLRDVVHLAGSWEVSAALTRRGEVYVWWRPHAEPGDAVSWTRPLRVGQMPGVSEIQLVGGVTASGATWTVCGLGGGQVQCVGTTATAWLGRGPDPVAAEVGPIVWPPRPTGIRIRLEPRPGTWLDDPIGGACVHYWGRGSAMQCVRTNLQGEAVFELPPGNYMPCRHRGGAGGHVSCPELCRFELRAGEVLDLDADDFFHEPTNQGIDGISHAHLNEGEHVKHDLRVCAAPVTAEVGDPLEGFTCVETGPCGQYRLDLEPGTYRVLVAEPGAEQAEHRLPCRFEVRPGTRHGLDLDYSTVKGWDATCPEGSESDPLGQDERPVEEAGSETGGA